MPAEGATIDAIFSGAIELATPEERAEFIQRQCGEDAELKRRVEALLAAHFRAGDFLESPPVVLPPSDNAIEEAPGMTVGPYKLLEQIGEGGMGVVFMAQQEEPVRRRVALKIIKPGMDSRKVIARFEAERQALALMDHPNIARVLDAGTSATGKPYFVMELVKGIPIIQYCDEHRLDPRQRLELFTLVCQAVQHAHQKGVIHRDLKPTNVLVADYDERPVPKIIDFGVAKAIDRPLTEKTMFTQFGQIVGTIEYMSPEQAKLNQLDVDTRSDIYSLGVLLYELLTGTTPLERERMRSAALDDMLRSVREDEPPKPSTRLSTNDRLPTIAANRGLEPKKLTGLVRGDLDWIVMKCLEKDRQRRYDTAAELADDLERYLTDQPVEAREPTRLYRVKKLIRRNKVAVLAGSAIAAALVLGLIVACFGFLQARNQAIRADHEAETARSQAATANRVTELLQQMLFSADPYASKGPDYKIHEALDEFADRIDAQLADQPEVAAALHATIGKAYTGLDDCEKARRHQLRALELRRATFGPQHEIYADSLIDYALANNDHSTPAEYAEDQANIRQALAIYRARAVDPKRIMHAYWALQKIFIVQRNWTELEAVAYEAQAEALKSPITASSEWPLEWLVHVDIARGESADAERIAREALARRIAAYGNDHMSTAWAYKDLGDALCARQKFKEALEAQQHSLIIMKQLLPPGHEDSENVRAQIANTLTSAGKAHALVELCASTDQLSELESLFRESPAAQPRYPTHFFDAANVAARALPLFPALYVELGEELLAAGNTEEAAKCRKKALDLQHGEKTSLPIGPTG